MPPLLPPGLLSPAELAPWARKAFWLTPTDPRLRALHAGGRAPTPQLDNVAGNVAAWEDWPEAMDYLDPASSLHRQKMLERALYEDRWSQHVPAGSRVLDLGCGIGRFSTWLLARGCEVESVDPDLRCLRALVRHAAALPETGGGRLAAHWSTGETLPDLAPVDLVVAEGAECRLAPRLRQLAVILQAEPDEEAHAGVQKPRATRFKNSTAPSEVRQGRAVSSKSRASLTWRPRHSLSGSRRDVRARRHAQAA